MDGDGLHQNGLSSSSEKRSAAAEDGRGWIRRSAGKSSTKTCQKGVHGENMGKGSREGARGVLHSPEMEKNSGGTAEIRWQNTTAWRRYSRGKGAEKREEREGYKMVVVVLPLALA